MAKVTIGSLISSITGKLGNHNFSQHKGGTTLRRTPTQRKGCKSSGQALPKSMLSLASKRWPLLSSAQRDGWEQYAGQLRGRMHGTDTQKKGGSGALTVVNKSWGIMSGYNAYVRQNVQAGSIGLPVPINDAPIGIDAPESLDPILYNYRQDLGIIFFLFTVPAPTIPTNQHVIYAQCGSVRIPSQIVRSVPGFVSGDQFENIRGTCGSVLPLITQGGPIRLQAVAYDKYGQGSVPSSTQEILLIAGG